MNTHADKKILIVSYYWPPGGGSGVQRWVKFCKYLPEFGIEPVVLTVENPTYHALDKSLLEDLPTGLNVFKSKSYEPFGIYAALTGKSAVEVARPTINLSGPSGAVSRMASWLRANLFIPDARVGWLLTARKKALEIAGQFDIDTVITTGPPHSSHYVGKYLKHTRGTRWIADFRDPWSDIFYNESLPRTRTARKIDRSMELNILKSADEVIVISPSMIPIQKKIYDRPYLLISNGFDPDDFKSVPKPPPGQRSFTIRHIGTVPEASVPYGLFEAVAGLPRPLSLQLEFIGSVHEAVPKLTEQYELSDHVKIKPYIPHPEAVSAMQTADLLLLIIPDADKNELILTGKIFEYLGSGTPVMAIGPEGGDAAKLVKEMNAGVCFEHEDTEGMKEYFAGIGKGTPSSENSLDSGSLKEHPYSRYGLTRKLANLINS